VTTPYGTVEAERTVVVDQSDPDPGRVDRARMGRRNRGSGSSGTESSIQRSTRGYGCFRSLCGLS